MTSNAIERYRVPEVTVRTDLDVMTLAKTLASSGYFKDAREAAQACVKVLAGAELGIPPIASMTGIYIVEGKVTLSANLIAGLIRRSGRYSYKVTALEDERCAITFTEGGQVVGESEYTKADATTAGLWGRATWKQYPRNMLFARAISNGARWFCPDVFSGPIYTPEEMGAVVDGETGEVIELPVAPPRAEPAPSPEPKAPPAPTTDAQVEQVGTLLGELATRAPDTDWNERMSDWANAKFGTGNLGHEQTEQLIRAMEGKLAALDAPPPAEEAA